MSELGNRLRRANVGLCMTGSILLSFLKFADDILLFSGLWSEMSVLVNIMEKWCRDFRMIISVVKTKIVSKSTNLLWRILNIESGSYEEVERLQHFKYLGVLQKFGAEATMVCNGRNKLDKAKTYHRNILRIRRLIPDRVEVYSAMWRNIALPSILCGLEAIPFSLTHEDQLEQVQLSLGKAILGVRQSTAGVSVCTELGFKPISLMISERKVRYVSAVMADNYSGSDIVKLLILEVMSGRQSAFYLDLANPLQLVEVPTILERGGLVKGYN